MCVLLERIGNRIEEMPFQVACRRDASVPVEDGAVEQATRAVGHGVRHVFHRLPRPLHAGDAIPDLESLALRGSVRERGGGHRSWADGVR